jgi:hypothetical protein
MSGLIIIIFSVLMFASLTYIVFFRKDALCVDSDPMLMKIRNNLMKVDPKYGDYPLYESNTGSYSENKSTITLCLKDPKTGKYYDMNTLMYVALHEIAHTQATNYGHGDEFKTVFANILKRAERVRIYDPKKPIVQSYCGLKV